MRAYFSANPRALWLLIAALYVVGMLILWRVAARRAARAQEADKVRRRAKPATELGPGTIYNIDGAVSMRTSDGGWMDIGHGAGTFQILPPPALVVSPADCAECRQPVDRQHRAEYSTMLGALGESINLHKWCVEPYQERHRIGRFRHREKQTPPTREG